MTSHLGSRSLVYRILSFVLAVFGLPYFLYKKGKGLVYKCYVLSLWDNMMVRDKSGDFIAVFLIGICLTVLLTPLMIHIYVQNPQWNWFDILMLPVFGHLIAWLMVPSWIFIALGVWSLLALFVAWARDYLAL